MPGGGGGWGGSSLRVTPKEEGGNIMVVNQNNQCSIFWMQNESVVDLLYVLLSGLGL